MTDNDLENKAQLWHVESTLEQEKAAQLETRLLAALPQARRRHLWQGMCVAAVAILLPIGTTTAILGINPLSGKAQIERLEFSRAGLTLDGTVVEAIQKERVITRNGQKMLEVYGKRFFLHRPGQHSPEPLAAPQEIQKALESAFDICAFLPGGALLVNGYPHGQILQAGRSTKLLPLPDYESSSVVGVTEQGIVGNSRHKLVPRSVRKQKDNGKIISAYFNYSVPTLWCNGQPEPLLRGTNPTSCQVIRVSPRGAVLLSMGEDTSKPLGAVLYQKKLTYLKPLEEDSERNLFTRITPRGIGKEGAVVGESTATFGTRGVLWSAGSERPQQLWKPRTWLDYEAISCTDIDETGRIVGTMTNEMLGRTTAFLWKDGYCTDLQRLLPRGSGWKLFSADRLLGRYILGRGEFQGQPAEFRLRLPKELE